VKEDQTFDDVYREEQSRGRPQPKKVITTERKRAIQQAAALLADSNCDLRQFLGAIRSLGYGEQSSEFQACVELWNDYRGKS